MTPELLDHAPALRQLGSARPWRSPVPAVTCTSQATMLTGCAPREHGIVANGWLYRQTQEIRFWQQTHSLIDRPTIYNDLTDRSVYSVFWWFPLGAPVTGFVTPRPFYGNDGSKVFAVLDRTDCELVSRLGEFPFPSFWGPWSGLPSSRWIARAAAIVLREKQPDLTMVYLPHLDYDYQRVGPGDTQRVAEVDAAAGEVIAAAREVDAQVVLVSEYGLGPVSQPIYINRALRKRDWITVREGPFGEVLQPFASRCFAVCDHQVAHIYCPGVPLDEARRAIEEIDGVEAVVPPGDLELEHPRAGELIAVAKPEAWFAYPFWLDDAKAPDYAHCIDIHRKPGYDPVELFMTSKWRAAYSLLRKKLGLRYRFDVIPLDARLVNGSHGRRVAGEHGPLLVGPGDLPEDMTGFRSYLTDLVKGA
jgi:predicted AlkP superfamily pyrophosphatase or phosphodiesterase